MAIFGPRWPLALPGSVLTPSTSPRRVLDRPTSDNDQFDPIFPKKIKNCYFLDPFGPSFTPLEVKIWPRDYHRKIRHEKLPRIHISNVSNRPLDPILWSNIWQFFDPFLDLSSRWPRPLCKKMQTQKLFVMFGVSRIQGWESIVSNSSAPWLF